MAEEREGVYFVYAPYLPLSFRETIGAWELIPRAALNDADARDAEVARLARGFADVFELPREPQHGVGAFARPVDGRVGDERDLDPIIDLRRALVVGALDRNASPYLPEEERSPNAGHETYTSDNAVVVAHPVTRDGWTHTITGGRVRTRELGIHVLPDEAGVSKVPIRPPGDLQIPLFAPRLDLFYANAAWESVGRGTDDARRLARAIDWLDAAWRNASALTDELRVPALRAGFEVLFDTHRTSTVRERLSALLDAPNAPKPKREWPNRPGSPTPAELSDLEWWFVRFSDLRDAFMHGRETDRDDWIHDGRWHTDVGEWWLRQAIKEAIARDGHDDIRVEMRERETLIRQRKMFERLTDGED
jgi:hypothetical protein